MSSIPTVIKVFSPSCGPCKVVEKQLTRELVLLAQDGIEVLYEEVDISTDEGQVFAKERGLRAVPTVIIEQDGEELERRVGLGAATALNTLR